MRVLNEFDSDKIVSKYIKVVENKVYSLEELGQIDIFPCYLKIMAPNMAHKKKQGAIFRVINRADLDAKQNCIISKCKSLNGEYILHQRDVRGEEFILGIKKDQKFGWILMLGIGGSQVEIIKDVIFRKIPITKLDAEQMVLGLKNQAIVARINRETLVKSLLKIQKIVKYSGFKELDINPLKVNAEAIVVDSKVYL